MIKAMQIVFGITTFLIQSRVLATSFVPTPIEDQVKTSQAVVRGTVLNQSYKKLPDGNVYTVVSFQVSASVGLDQTKATNLDAFNVLIPGGEWQGIAYHVSKAPTFSSGEDVVLLLSDHPYGASIHNLAMGKYNVVKEGNQEILKSALFTDHPRLGQISLNKFQKIILNIFGEEFISMKNQKLNKRSNGLIPHSRNSQHPHQRRRPASVESQSDLEKNEEQSSDMIPILIVLLAGLGLYSAQRMGRSE